MTSMRVGYSLSQLKGKITSVHTISTCIQQDIFVYVATHCLIEWDETNSPISVVERKNVVSLQSVRDPQIGDNCIVKVRERSKTVEYLGKLLATGNKKKDGVGDVTNGQLCRV